jgi:hypothetical protein
MEGNPSPQRNLTERGELPAPSVLAGAWPKTTHGFRAFTSYEILLWIHQGELMGKIVEVLPEHHCGQTMPQYRGPVNRRCLPGSTGARLSLYLIFIWIR